jgi:hypothetical protein
MSQLQVTGEAKIRDIQGPVVANSGVITALDGAANQYVRGDGTLAIFPTSSGGGSSVSYYLNGSVNQGTFGGSTYYQMSRNAIVGTGTNFSTSSDGLIAQFITDANDPDVVSIPSGNWNVEFFMNVSASSGALASFYVEIYKYNGSTFTLLATNVATPEQLTNTTTVDAYFTSVAMPLSAMAVTDRLAVRIFANVASKTVTLYTEDNRLCQIVTTFSNGLTSLNNLTDQSQYLAVGTSGTDFNIVSSGDTHTFNLPIASATNTGKLSSTDWSTFNAKQPAGNYVTLDTTQTITAAKTFTENPIINGTGTNSAYTILQSAGTNKWRIGNNYAAGVNTFDIFAYDNTTTPLSINSNGAMTLSANVTTTGAQFVQNGFYLTNANGGYLAGYTLMYGKDDGINFALRNGTGGASFIFPSANSYAYTFPAATGTLALTSNLSSYLPLTGGTLTGALNGTSATFSGQLNANYGYFGDTGAGSWVLYTTNNDQSNARIRMKNSGAGGQTFDLVSGLNGTSNAGWSIYDVTNGATRFAIASTGAATFSSSVTTPSITNGGQFKMDYGANASSRSWRLISDSYNFGDFSIQQSTTQSGSTYADRLLISATGNVGIGTSSPDYPLVVQANSSGAQAVKLLGRSVDNISILSFHNNANSTQYGYIAGIPSEFRINSGSSIPITFTNADTERMRITSGGNVGIGTSSPSQLLEIANASGTAYARLTADFGSGFIGMETSDDSMRILTAQATPIQLYTNNAERMRIRNDGIILIGTTAYNSALKGVLINPDGYAFYTVDNNTTSTANIYLNRLNADGKLLIFQKNTTDTGYISTNTYSLPSDLNFKKNISNLELGLNLITKLRAVSYNHKIDDADAALSTGFIAQELEQSLTELGVKENKYYILQHKPNEDENQSQYWLDYTKMIPILVKAIQEQQAQIEANIKIINELNERIVTLESK